MDLKACPKTINDVDADGNDCFRDLDRSASVLNGKCTYKKGCNTDALKKISKGLTVSFDATSDDLNDQNPNGSQTKKSLYVIVESKPQPLKYLLLGAGGLLIGVPIVKYADGLKGNKTLRVVAMAGGFLFVMGGLVSLMQAGFDLSDKYSAPKQQV